MCHRMRLNRINRIINNKLIIYISDVSTTRNKKRTTCIPGQCKYRQFSRFCCWSNKRLFGLDFQLFFRYLKRPAPNSDHPILICTNSTLGSKGCWFLFKRPMPAKRRSDPILPRIMPSGIFKISLPIRLAVQHSSAHFLNKNM